MGYGEIQKFHVLRLEKGEEVAPQCRGTAADAVAVVCTVALTTTTKKRTVLVQCNEHFQHVLPASFKLAPHWFWFPKANFQRCIKT